MNVTNVKSMMTMKIMKIMKNNLKRASIFLACFLWIQLLLNKTKEFPRQMTRGNLKHNQLKDY